METIEKKLQKKKKTVSLLDDDSSNDDIDSDGNSSADVRVSHWSNKRTKQEQHFVKSSAEKLKIEFKEAHIEATEKLNTKTLVAIKKPQSTKKVDNSVADLVDKSEKQNRKVTTVCKVTRTKKSDNATVVVADLVDKCKGTTEKKSDNATIKISDNNSETPLKTLTSTSKTLTGINALICRSANYAALEKLREDSQYGIRRVNLNRNIKVLAEPRDDPNCNMTIDTSWSITVLKTKLRVRLANVPGDGNCAFACILAALNDDNETNYNCYDKTVVQCRRFTMTQLMNVLSSNRCYEYINHVGERYNTLMLAAKDPYRTWYNVHKEDSYLPKNDDNILDGEAWMESHFLYHVMAMILHKSIVVFTCEKVNQNSDKYKNVGHYIFIKYDPLNPDYYPVCQINEVDSMELRSMRNGKKRQGESKSFNIDPENTVVVVHYYNMHYDVLVKYQQTVKNISDGILPQEMKDIPNTIIDEKDHLHISPKLYEVTKKQYKKMLNDYVFKEQIGMIKTPKCSDKMKLKK